ncbi:prepilin-type N-terminal cleavage/methylation domain-containing protein [Candidatus Daviesbacteria bacterium]|nr:prepilin-type N-terminal cleavage/methylation domain-containing protein [Candidatus Daviesbacteria bacterium]
MKKSGFTLVELLITITIIAVLTTVGAVAYTSFFKNSRDSKRLSDLKLIQSALETYYADQLYYPSSDSITPVPVPTPPGIALTNATGTSISPTNPKTYLSSVPTDPLISNTSYSYKAYKLAVDGRTFVECANSDNASASTAKCVKYCLFVQLENTTLTSDSGCTVLPAGFTAPKAYGVTRP